LQAIAPDSHGDRNYRRAKYHVKSFLSPIRLLDAAQSGSLPLAEKLLNNGVPVDSCNHSGETALHVAVKNGHYDIVALLLDRKADIGRRDSEGNTAIHHAVSTLLLDRNADIGRRDGEENPAIQLATLLLERGANPKAKNKSGKSALDLAKDLENTPEDGMSRLLRAPPLLCGPKVSQPAAPVVKRPKTPTSKHAVRACKDFRAVAMEFFIIEGIEKRSREPYCPTVYDLLYDHDKGPQQILEKSRSDTKVPPRCTWYHLPANNVRHDVSSFREETNLKNDQITWVEVYLVSRLHAYTAYTILRISFRRLATKACLLCTVCS